LSKGAFLTAFSGGIGLALATGFCHALAMLPAQRVLIRRESSRHPRWQQSVRWRSREFPPAFIRAQSALMEPVEALRQE